MNENTISLSKDSYKNRIDKVLHDEPDAIRVRVYELLLDLDIDPDDTLFLFLIVLQHVRVLVDNEPIQLKKLFDTFNIEIEKWTEQNIQTLEKIAKKAELTEQIAENTSILSELIKELLTASKTLLEPLQKSSANSLNSISQLKTSLIRQENSIQSLLEEMQNFTRENQELTAILSDPRFLKRQKKASQKTKKKKWITNLILILLCFNLIFIGMLFLVELQTKKEVNWLLQKANRRECLAGIKKPNSPECAGII